MKKKTLIFCLLAAALLAAGVLGYFIFYAKLFSNQSAQQSAAPDLGLIKQQTEELDRLRRQNNAEPASSGQIQEELNRLNELRRSTDSRPPSAEQIKAQLEELNKLRVQTKL